MGKPPVLRNAKIETFSASEEMRAGIEEFRRQQSPIPTKAEAIRRLVEIGLNATRST
jgi:hypothetical protein